MQSQEHLVDTGAGLIRATITGEAVTGQATQEQVIQVMKLSEAL